MKNISILNLEKKQSCNYCKSNGFFCFTKECNSYISCGICGTFVPIGEEEEEEEDKIWRFCEKCGILFSVGNKHTNIGFIDWDIYHTKFIKKWKKVQTMEELEGMPFFECKEDWIKNKNSIKVLESCYPNRPLKCNEFLLDRLEKYVYPNSKVEEVVILNNLKKGDE